MRETIAGKQIAVGVTGSIASFKVAGWVSNLVKLESDVSVIMTPSAEQFVTPLSFKALSGKNVFTEMFNDLSEDGMDHIRIGQESDLIIVAPASANTLAKLAYGMADNLLTSTILATRAPVLIFPAMNPAMYSHQATQKNISTLLGYGYHVIDPETGRMACKDSGKGRLVEWESALEEIFRALDRQELKNKKVLVTAGPTREHIDPARYISNKSSGKMGYAIARSAWRQGAEVTLISGPTMLNVPYGVNAVSVETAEQMKAAVDDHAGWADYICMNAAVSDFKPAITFSEKVKKREDVASLDLVRTDDILSEVGQGKKSGQVLIGFAAETSNHMEEAQRKLQQKNLDFIAVNDIGSNTTGFAADTNQVTLLSTDSSFQLPFTTKEHLADILWHKILSEQVVSNKG